MNLTPYAKYNRVDPDSEGFCYISGNGPNQHIIGLDRVPSALAVDLVIALNKAHKAGYKLHRDQVCAALGVSPAYNTSID